MKHISLMQNYYLIPMFLLCTLLISGTQGCAFREMHPSTAEPARDKEELEEPEDEQDSLEDQNKHERGAVLELLRAYKHLSTINALVINLSEPISSHHHQRLTDLCLSLPASVKKDIDFSMGDIAKWRAFTKKWAQVLGVKRAHDLGGHGGTFIAGVNLGAHKIHHVFLKPKDPVEERNYRIINTLAPELAALMPTLYGTVELGHSSFIAMKNINYTAQGESLNPLADIKLAGKLQGKDSFNPIADQQEMLVTRNYEKGWFDYHQMALGAQSSPHYMIVQSKLRIGRIFRYKDSEKYLLKILAKCSRQELEELDNQVHNLARILERSPVAFIGASIILMQGAFGPIKLALVDPAHMQVDPVLRGRALSSLESSELGQVYYGDHSSYADRKESNRVALEAIRATIAKAGN